MIGAFGYYSFICDACLRTTSRVPHSMWGTIVSQSMLLRHNLGVSSILIPTLKTWGSETIETYHIGAIMC